MGNSERSSKPWYRKWWGILIVICIWPYFFIWYVWKKARWPKAVRIVATAACAFVALMSIGLVAATSNPQTTKNSANSSNVVSQNSQSATGGNSSVPITLTPQEQAQFNEAQNGAQNQPSSPTPPQPQTLLDISGQGNKQTQKFTTSGDWTLTYNYDCSQAGGTGNFMVDIYNDDGTPDTSDTSVNELGASGTDIEYYYDAGTFYLSINSECSWHVTVKG